MDLKPYIAVGGAGLLWHHFTNRPAMRTSDAHRQAARALQEMPCGVPRVEVDGIEQINSYSDLINLEWHALSSKYGSIGLATGDLVPKVPAGCCAEWLENWVKRAELAEKRFPQKVYRSYNINSSILPDPIGALKGTRLSAFGSNMKAMSDLRFKLAVEISGDPEAALEDSGKVSKNLGALQRRLFQVANGLDGLIFRDNSNRHDQLGYGHFFSEQVKITSQGIGNAFGFLIEGVAAPILGTGLGAAAGVLASSVAPYLVVGGVGYYALKRGKL